MTIREYIYQSNIDWTDNLLKLIEEFKQSDEKELTREELVKNMLNLSTEMVSIKKGIVEEVIATIDRIDVTLLNHKVPKSKLK